MKRRSNVRAPKTIRPLRVERRPDPREWADDELITLPEAAALFWPEGPLTTTSLRTAVRDRMLEVAEIAGKILTTKAAIGRMSSCRLRGRPDSPDIPPSSFIPRTVRELRMSRSRQQERA